MTILATEIALVQGRAKHIRGLLRLGFAMSATEYLRVLAGLEPLLRTAFARRYALRQIGELRRDLAAKHREMADEVA